MSWRGRELRPQMKLLLKIHQTLNLPSLRRFVHHPARKCCSSATTPIRPCMLTVQHVKPLTLTRLTLFPTPPPYLHPSQSPALLLKWSQNPPSPVLLNPLAAPLCDHLSHHVIAAITQFFLQTLLLTTVPFTVLPWVLLGAPS